MTSMSMNDPSVDWRRIHAAVSCGSLVLALAATCATPVPRLLHAATAGLQLTRRAYAAVAGGDGAARGPTAVSTTLEGPLDRPDATLVSPDAVDVVARLKKESEVPLRSHGSLSMNQALMAAGLVDRVRVTLFPVITGQTDWTRSSGVRPTSTSS